MTDSYKKMDDRMKSDGEARYIPQGMNAQRLHDEELARVAERQRQGVLDLGDEDRFEGAGSG